MSEQSSKLESMAIFAASCALGSVGALGAMTGDVILLSAFAFALLVWLTLILPPLLKAEAARKAERRADARWVELNRVSVREAVREVTPRSIER